MPRTYIYVVDKKARKSISAGIPVWVKQIPYGKKVTDKIEDFPKELQLRQLPK